MISDVMGNDDEKANGGAGDDYGDYGDEQGFTKEQEGAYDFM